MVNLACQIDIIWIQLTAKFIGNLMGDLLDQIIGKKTYPKPGTNLLLARHVEGMDERSFAFLSTHPSSHWLFILSIYLVLNVASSELQNRLKSSSSPGILQDSIARLGTQRHQLHGLTVIRLLGFSL